MATKKTTTTKKSSSTTKTKKSVASKKTTSKRTTKTKTASTKATTKNASKKVTSENAFAIFKVGGSQVMGKVGQEISVENISAQKGDKLMFEEVVLLYDGDKTEVGTPTVKGCKVSATVVSVKKGKKIKGMKYKAKARYRKRFGSRPTVVRFSIDSITR